MVVQRRCSATDLLKTRNRVVQDMLLAEARSTTELSGIRERVPFIASIGGQLWLCLWLICIYPHM